MKKQNEVKKTVVVMENEQPTEGMPGAEQAKVARDAEREAMKAANEQAKFSRRNQPVACRVCGKKTTWSEANGNSDLALCHKCFDAASTENEHFDGHHQEAPLATCPLCVASMIPAAEKALKAEIKAGRKKIVKDSLGEAEIVDVMPTVETLGKLVTAVDALIPGMGAMVLSEKGKQALADVQVPEAPVVEAPVAPAVDAVEASAKTKVKAKGKAVAAELKATEKKAKAPKKAAAAAMGTLTLRLYAKGHFWFGKKQTELLKGLPYVLVAVEGKQVTLTPTKSKKDSVEVKFSHGSPQVSIGKLLGEWSKATQDLPITMVGDSIQVEVL